MIMMSVIAICMGASLGALARWGLGLWLSPGGVIPWGTLAANLIGRLPGGVAVAVFQALPQLDPAWRSAAGHWFSGSAHHLFQLFGRGGRAVGAAALRVGNGDGGRAPVRLIGLDGGGHEVGLDSATFP